MKLSVAKENRLLAGILLVIMAICVASVLQYWAIAYIGLAIFSSLLIRHVTVLTKYAVVSNSWPSVPSRRVQAYVEDNEDHDDGSHSYEIRVAYGYTVDGKTYRGRRLRFPFGIAGSVSGMYKKAKSLNRASDIPVYYDPSDPKICTLQRGLSILDGMGLLLFYAISVPALLILVYLGLTSVV